jgi:hypothetical protein
MCSQHLGGISGIGQDAEFLFQGNQCNRGLSQVKKTPFNYALVINPGTLKSTTWAGNGKPLSVPVKPASLNSLDWRFWVSLPTPDVLVTLNPVDAKIVGKTTQPGPYAVGVRFIYNQWDGADIPVFLNGQPAKTPSTSPNPNTPVIFKGTLLGEPNRLDLEIEYSGAVRDDPDHEDAVTCFETMMKALKLDWTIGFISRGGTHPDVTHRSDCKAAIAWMP